MASSTTTSCDRCGEAIEEPYHALKLAAKGRWFDPNDQTNEYKHTIDLCSVCKKEFFSFLEACGQEIDVMTW